jgi:hypothetical protein
MGVMSTSLAPIAITAAAFIVQTDAAKAANPKIEFAAARTAASCPDRPGIHMRRYGHRGGGAPTRCPPKG